MERVLPIAEVFESIQGEGTWVGTPMLFLRLAGCNVGKPAKALKVGPFPMLHTGVEAMACSTYDGRIFPCDTDYGLKKKLPIEDVMVMLEGNKYRHVCVTGGEPFLHDFLLEELFYELASRDIMMHVETSGTKYPTSRTWPGDNAVPGYWITCAPKLGALTAMINRADELKLLVDEDFDEFKLSPEMFNHKNVFVCPINAVGMDSGQNNVNVQRCRELLHAFPQWRLSVQLHKFFNWR